MVNKLPDNIEIEKESISGNDDNGIINTLSGCSSNDDANPYKNYARRRKCNENVQICEKQKKRETYQRISIILRKSEEIRTADEHKQLESNADIVRQINKRRENIANTRERILEKEDPPELIEEKAKKLANVLSRAQHLVCYTGAGISTSARIPDYRGSQGIWTLLQQGKEIGQYDLSLADPTYTHMSLFELNRRNILRYTLSQNCDGLHLRSGLPRKLLSEIHGNMYIEVCKYCKPNVEYWRLFDTTELTARYNHKTNRRCHFCLKPLIDTIVHFGERGRLKWPLNWESACKNAEKADVILCLGSSLKVLKKYAWLWQMDRPKSKRPKIYIVNLQWTPKDKNASLKINGKCDEVMKLVMNYMNINVAPYDRIKDPIFAHASLLLPEEVHTVTQPMLRHHIDKTEITEEIKQEIKDECKENVDEDKMENSMTNEIVNINIEVNKTDTQIIENQIKCAEDIKTEESDIETYAAIHNERTNGTNESMEIECLGEKELKDCSSTDNDVDVKLTPSGHIDESAKSNTQNHEMSSQSTDNEKPINIESNTELPRSNGEMISYQKLDLAKMATSPSNLSFGLSDKKHDENYFKSLINYYRAIDGVMPHWYDVNYAYSGLHSIINPPPNEVDIWSTIIIPIHQLNRNLAECEFCFDNYAEDKCQFYKSLQEFHVSVTRLRNGKRILCECCDSDDFDNDENRTSLDEIDGSEEPKTNSEEDDDSNRTKRVKADIGKVTTQQIVQPGWYGKGYRKTTKRKKTRRLQLR